MTASEARQRLSWLFAAFGMNGALVIPKSALPEPPEPPEPSGPAQPSEALEPPPFAPELSDDLGEAELFRRIFGDLPPR
ncbi:hypothetical protein [Streptomyces sp. NPDC057539]|uniref:hypothetical protein n=1 Tax=unclassified Streptomyces TaxID=2593676 RepID=UPI003663872D